MLYQHIAIQGLKGVGAVDLRLEDPNQSVCVLIGENGVGKTKTLEALFQALLVGYKVWPGNSKHHSVDWCFSEISIDQSKVVVPSKQKLSIQSVLGAAQNTIENHPYPMIFLASQNRGHIEHKNQGQYQKRDAELVGSFEQRREAYLTSLVQGMDKNFASLNMDKGIEEWFVSIAQSSNPYQKKSDNREVELKTVLRLLNQIDSRISADPTTVEVGGDYRVSLTIDGEKRQLSHLSTGFASILKIIQAIVSGYGYFTNETQLQNVRGIVLIDEIESHMHLSWQARIVPLLKQLFPNTTFYITTHSSMVLSQLNEGEAWRLQRDADGVVRNKAIAAPNKAVLVDVLKDAFGIDVNQMKRDRMNAAEQQQAKRELLALIQGEGA